MNDRGKKALAMLLGLQMLTAAFAGAAEAGDLFLPDAVSEGAVETAAEKPDTETVPDTEEHRTEETEPTAFVVGTEEPEQWASEQRGDQEREKTPDLSDETTENVGINDENRQEIDMTVGEEDRGTEETAGAAPEEVPLEAMAADRTEPYAVEPENGDAPDSPEAGSALPEPEQAEYRQDSEAPGTEENAGQDEYSVPVQGAAPEEESCFSGEAPAETELSGEVSGPETETGTGADVPAEGVPAPATDGNDSPTPSSVSVFDLSLTDATEENAYRQLRFRFTSQGQDYYCLVTGLRSDAGADHAGYALLAREIADSFLSGGRFTLSSETALERYGLTLDLIDAEKEDTLSPGDRNICWAASAANMLELAGWNVHGDEDGAFADFRENFSDLGGYQEAGISWYLDGVNTEQYITTSGRITYRELETGASQQLQPGTGGYWTEYAAGEAAQQFSARTDGSTVLDQALAQLEDGYSLGIGAYFYQDGRYLRSGHALTVFGYIRETADRIMGSLRALLIADSDDRGRNQAEAAADRPDEYVMYRTEEYNGAGLSAVNLADYKEDGLQTLIGNITVLAPRAAMEERQETAGTRDARNTANLVPEAVTALDAEGLTIREAEPGSEMTLQMDFTNRSYTALPAGAVIRYAVYVYRDGEIAETLERSVSVGDGLKPMRGAADSLTLTLGEAGDYTFGWKILGIESAEGSELPEAYTRDNLYFGLECGLTVRAADPEPEEKPEPEEEPAPDTPEAAEGAESGGGGEETRRKAEKIYRLTLVLATDTDYTLYFESETPSVKGFRSLLNRDTRELVAPEMYTITRAGNGYQITFEEAFIETLAPGDHMYVLCGTEDRVLIQIRIL